MLIEPKKNDEFNQQKWDLSSEPDASFHDLPNSGQFQLQLYTTLLVLQTKKWIWKHHVIGIWRSEEPLFHAHATKSWAPDRRRRY